ncbi:26S proteasome non-ATPase regulatory subunit 5 [Syncephalastrum racemosum]|uniref:26S proteasome non-ATPase regulatory subunit 5 n=1 Tax=Syncephalastrum racemosum TaxID=13706 RepID=A0A1X2H8C7_SYNRA|nr:26S proteasome non-ATPase regulatory subunit 5 [Syncephalastrum racemosum]
MPGVESPIERAARALQPQSSMAYPDKLNALQSFLASLGERVDLDSAQAILHTVPLPLFYNAFETTADEDQDLVKLLCQIVGKLLRPIPFDVFVADPVNQEFLIRGLQHFSPDIRYLSLQQVETCLSKPNTVRQVATSTVFAFTLTSVAFQDTRTANKAVDVAVKIASEMPSVLFEQSTSILQGLFQTNETVRFRVFELIIRVAGSSSEAFELGEASGLFQVIVQEVQSDDILLRLNAVEMLTQIATSPSGLAFLQRTGLLHNLARMITDSNDTDTVAMLTKHAAFHFFGHLGRNKDINFQPIDRECHVFNAILKCLEDPANPEIEITAMHTASLIASKPSGLQLFYNSAVVDPFFDRYKSSTGDVKIAYLRSLAAVLSVEAPTGSEEAALVEQMTKDLFLRTGNGGFHVLSNLVQNAKQPVDDIRMAALSVLQSTASHQWGREYMAQSSDFMGYILDRTNDHSAAGLNAKYDIVSALGRAPAAQQTFGDHYPMIRQYISQGPYYRETTTEVAMESG